MNLSCFPENGGKKNAKKKKWSRIYYIIWQLRWCVLFPERKINDENLKKNACYFLHLYGFDSPTTLTVLWDSQISFHWELFNHLLTLATLSFQVLLWFSWSQFWVSFHHKISTMGILWELLYISSCSDRKAGLIYLNKTNTCFFHAGRNRVCSLIWLKSKNMIVKYYSPILLRIDWQ